MKRFRMKIAESGEAVLIVEAGDELAAFERAGMIAGRNGPDADLLRGVWTIEEHHGPFDVHYFSNRYFELNLHLEQSISEEEHM